MTDPHRPFRPGERVLLVDSKARRYLITLVEGGSFSTHAGTLPHADLIGRDEGILVRTSHGARLRAIRPTLSDYILKMPRGAQVIYPKDIGPILMLADIFPGARLLEAGVGSGALSMALLRAVGREGSVIGYEIREDFAARAAKNVESFLGPDQPYRVEIRDVYEGIEPSDSGPAGLDRIVLDLPEPWRVVKHATVALRPGGILVSYLPTIGQVARLREELDGSPFGLAETPGGAPALVARRGPVGAARPPHGGPHRVPHRRPAARPRPAGRAPGPRASPETSS